jgi:hypothetical protein
VLVFIAQSAACDFPIRHRCVLWYRPGVGLVRSRSEVAVARAAVRQVDNPVCSLRRSQFIASPGMRTRR